jgi:hypothetical protein
VACVLVVCSIFDCSFPALSYHVQMNRSVSVLSRISSPPVFDTSRAVTNLSTVYSGEELDFWGVNKDGKNLLTISAGKVH